MDPLYTFTAGFTLAAAISAWEHRDRKHTLIFGAAFAICALRLALS